MVTFDCKCGCGTKIEKYDSRGRIRFYKHGHSKNFLGKHHTEKTKQKLRLIKWKGGEKASNKRYYLKNIDRIKIIQKKYGQKYRYTPERKMSYTKFNQSPKGFYKTLKSNSKIKGRNFNLKQEDFLDWYEKQEKVCFYCGIPEELLIENPLFMRKLKTKELVFRLSIDRKDNRRSYEIQNIVLACRLCNSIKNNVFTSQEMKEISEKYILPKWKK